MKISIIGAGYVGLTTGTCFAELGHTVDCVDNNKEKLAMLEAGRSPIFEPGLEELIVKNRDNGRLRFSNDIASAVTNAEVIFICVNTPPKPDGQADLKYVEAVAREIAASLDGSYKVIVDKSTVPVHTAEKVRETIERYGKDHSKFDVVSNPEFLREGTAVKDTMEPDRIVIGVDNDHAREVMLRVFEPIIKNTDAPVKVVSVRSAELIKHGANTFLANKISFANLIAEACELAGADALEVLEAIGLDERIGAKFLNPGIGFGGSCFPKDIAAFRKTLEVLGVDPTFVTAIESINDSAIQRFIKKIEKELWILDGKIITVLGLAFKPDTDDIRNSPALKVIDRLMHGGARVQAFDPKAMENTKRVMPNITYANNAYEAVKGSEALIICTEWQEFKNLDLSKIKSLMATPIIFDGRNIFNPDTAQQLGFKYIGIGR